MHHQKTQLDFVGDVQWLQFGEDGKKVMIEKLPPVSAKPNLVYSKTKFVVIGKFTKPPLFQRKKLTGSNPFFKVM